MDFCKKEAISILQDASVEEAVKIMKDKGVGALIVVDEARHPVGMLTDRDIVIKVVAKGMDVHSTQVSTLMSKNLLIFDTSQSFQDAIEHMQKKRVRRAPIIDENKKLCGIVTLDDLLIAMGKWLNKLTDLIAKKVENTSSHYKNL